MTWTIPASEDIPLAGRICFGIHGNRQSDLYIRNLKLECGTMATDWTPAPEDTDAKITEEIDTAITKGKDDILLTVKDTYTAKTEYDGKIQSIEAWQSAASQKLTKDGITAIVGSYYTTSEDFNDLTKRVTLSETSISQNADEIKLRVKAGEIISTINQSAEAIQISADKVNLAGYVTISSLAGSGTTTIDGSNIKTGTIDSDRIGAKSITADKISVDSLQSISASIGGFTIDDTAIYKGSAALGTSGNGNIYLGDAGFSLSDKLKYDVADGSLAISGKVTATEGTIGGFTIGKTSLYSGTTALGATANSVYLGTDGISCGDRFIVDKGGKIKMYATGNYSEEAGIEINQYTSLGKFQTYMSAGYLAMIDGGDVKTANGKSGVTILPGEFNISHQWNAGGEETDIKPGEIVASKKIISRGEVMAGEYTANAFRAVYGNYGFIIRNDGTNTYLMTTKSGDPYGTWNKFIIIRNDTCNTVFPGEVSASTVKIKYKYWFTDAYTQEKAITATWKDGAGHDLCHIDADGLTCYYGWAGTASYATKTIIRGRTVQAKNASGTSTLSDERLKHGFKSLDEFDDVYMDIDPCAFQYNSGSSGRYHFGAKAQNVKMAFERHGYSTHDFGGLVQTEDNPANEDYCGVPDPWSLIYTEFTMWNMHMTQKALKEIQALKERINTQQYMLEQVMARLSKLEKAS